MAHNNCATTPPPPHTHPHTTTLRGYSRHKKSFVKENDSDSDDKCNAKVEFLNFKNFILKIIMKYVENCHIQGSNVIVQYYFNGNHQ